MGHDDDDDDLYLTSEQILFYDVFIYDSHGMFKHLSWIDSTFKWIHSIRMDIIFV